MPLLGGAAPAPPLVGALALRRGGPWGLVLDFFGDADGCQLGGGPVGNRWGSTGSQVLVPFWLFWGGLGGRFGGFGGPGVRFGSVRGGLEDIVLRKGRSPWAWAHDSLIIRLGVEGKGGLFTFRGGVICYSLR